MLGIMSNPSASMARLAYGRATHDINQSFERLATGKKINRAGDDLSGLQAAENFNAREKQLSTRIESIDREGAYFGARDGAVSVLQDYVVELNGLVVAAANGAGNSPAEKQAMQLQADSILQTIDFLSQTTTFNGQQILTGYSAKDLGATNSDGSENQHTLADLARGGELNLSGANLEDAQKIVEASVNQLSANRAAIGNMMTDLDSERRISLTELENVSSARSAITDTDYAEETSKLVRAQVMQAAAYTRQISQQQQAGSILSLLSSAVKSRGSIAGV